MLKVSVYVMGSLLHKISEPAFSQSIFITHGKIATHLVNRDLKYELGLSMSRSGNCPN
jgi:hypothetical protein